MIGARIPALLCVVGLLGCKPDAPAEAPITLVAASKMVTFGTVEQLGPHVARASITRTDLRDGVEVSAHEEVSEVGWQDWDHFHYRRIIDDQPAIDVMVIDGQAFARQGDGPWQQRQDPEPFRLQLRTTWNAWEQALEIFGNRVELTEVGADEVDGRHALRYEVSLAPIELGKKHKKRAFEPTRLSGLAWIDEATAIHVTARVEGEAKQGNLIRRVLLKISRSDFGQSLVLTAPTEVVARPVVPESVQRPRGGAP